MSLLKGAMNRKKNHIRLDPRSPAGGIPFNLKNGIPLARADLNSGESTTIARGETRAGPKFFDTGPPGRNPGNSLRQAAGWVGPPGRDGPACIPCPKRRDRQRGRSPDDVRRHGVNWRTNVTPEAVLARAMPCVPVIREGWSPPCRNGPIGSTSPGRSADHVDVSGNECAEGIVSSVVRSRDGKEFFRGVSSGTPSLSPFSGQTEESFTVNTFS